MTGVLIDDTVVVKEQKEGSQLYNKGNYGYPRSGGGVDLDLVEATYLVESRRLEVEHDGEPMSFDELFRYSASVYEGFDIKYMVYRDIRQRGFVVKIESGDYDLSVFPRGKTMSNSRPVYMVKAVSERNAFEISHFMRQASDVRDRRKDLLYGVVDEEGDLTYYMMSVKDPVGKVFPEAGPGKVEGWLIRDRVFIFDQEGSEAIRNYGYYGKMMTDVLQLSLIESCYLIGKGRLTVLDPDGEPMSFDDLMDFGVSLQDEFHLRFMAFSDLRERGLVVKTGFKYGTHFRVYEESPDDCHARYLVHAVSEDGLKMWPEISRTVRLSGGVKKEILFGRVHKNRIQYLEFKWFRP
ncbi:MAG: tRNA-intron lyase [Candidatus Methanomethylophilaceae archaeon]|nr:tRNA-intron lyase [Candidatus Methanomethylophilaceae archaeon]